MEIPASIVEDWKPHVLTEAELTRIQEKEEISKAWMENRKTFMGTMIIF